MGLRLCKTTLGLAGARLETMGTRNAELVACSKFGLWGPAFCWCRRVGPVFSDPRQPEVNLPCSQLLVLRPVMGTDGLFRKGGILTPMIAVPSSCHSRNLNDNGSCPRFAARIPDSARWFSGTLRQHSLLVEFADQIVRWRAGCGRLDFTSRFDANLLPLGGLTGAALFAGVLDHLWMWFSPRSGVSKSRDEVGAIDVSARNLTNTQWSRLSGCRLPGGAATVWRR